MEDLLWLGLILLLAFASFLLVGLLVGKGERAGG